MTNCNDGLLVGLFAPANPKTEYFNVYGPTYPAFRWDIYDNGDGTFSIGTQVFFIFLSW